MSSINCEEIIYPCDWNPFGECPYAIQNCRNCFGITEKQAIIKITKEEEIERILEEEYKNGKAY